MDCVRRRIGIFHNTIYLATMALLVVIGTWDVIKKEIPIILLIGLSITAILAWSEAFFVEQLWELTMAGFLGAGGILLVRSEKLGGGDLWVLICLVMIWPVDVFWMSLSKAIMIMCTVALGIWILKKDENYQIPMIPFLLLGYWI